MLIISCYKNYQQFASIENSNFLFLLKNVIFAMITFILISIFFSFSLSSAKSDPYNLDRKGFHTLTPMMGEQFDTQIPLSRLMTPSSWIWSPTKLLTLSSSMLVMLSWWQVEGTLGVLEFLRTGRNIREALRQFISRITLVTSLPLGLVMCLQLVRVQSPGCLYPREKVLSWPLLKRLGRDKQPRQQPLFSSILDGIG